VAPNLQVERLAADNVTVLQGGSPVSPGGTSLSMRWENAVSLPVASQHLRISAGTCGGSCGVEDVYRVRVWDTTLRLARFNNSATQTTVVILSNPSDAPVSGHVNFWSGAGALLRSHPFTVAAHGTSVTNSSTLTGVQGQSGTVTVSHDAPHGKLNGKAVALEPATGFTFDSVIQPRER
jgi:hypothetical protein